MSDEYACVAHDHDSDSVRACVQEAAGYFTCFPNQPFWTLGRPGDRVENANLFGPVQEETHIQHCAGDVVPVGDLDLQRLLEWNLARNDAAAQQADLAH